MKKSFLIVASVFILLLSNPLFAQLADPGADPEPVAPIDGYVYVLAAIGLVFVFLRFKTLSKQANLG